MRHKLLPITSPLESGKDTDRAEREGFFFCPAFVSQFRFCVHNIPDNLAVKLDYKIQCGDEIFMPAHDMDEVMFHAAFHIKVIKCFSCDFFNCFIICFCFIPYYYHSANNPPSPIFSGFYIHPFHLAISIISGARPKVNRKFAFAVGFRSNLYTNALGYAIIATDATGRSGKGGEARRWAGAVLALHCRLAGIEDKDMKQLIQGIKDGSAIGIGYFSVSFTFGLAAVSSGLCWWEALLVSMMNLTSAGQFAGITVMASAGPYAEMAISQLVINLRYALMGISLSQKVDRRFLLPQKSVLGFAITDEIFAVAMSRDGEVGSAYFSGLALLPYLGWAAGTLTGAVCGNILPGNIRDALGIAIYGMFIAIIIPAMKADGRILKMAALAVLLSCCMHYLPVLRNVSEGFSVIICAVAASAAGAFFFPMEEGKEEGKG